MPDTENTDKIQSDSKPWQFKQGQSGNPNGKPKGARNKTTLAIQELLDGESETITRKAIELAKAGDMTAIRLVMERILPARKDSPITFEMPVINKLNDIVAAVGAVIKAVSDGEITPSEGQSITAMVENLRRSIETLELEQKLEHLESLIKSRN
ncbi:MAG: hypothetical protein K0R98_690 [Rickettsiaceae bacterium]|jgi:hypothetical protein|nr:hypothetical protein [Rickettsiaceae bacterium]